MLRPVENKSMASVLSSLGRPQLVNTSITTMNLKDWEKFREELKSSFCDEVGKYEKISQIGQGTFGEVFKARHKRDQKIVAVKKVLMDNDQEEEVIACLT